MNVKIGLVNLLIEKTMRLVNGLSKKRFQIGVLRLKSMVLKKEVTFGQSLNVNAIIVPRVVILCSVVLSNADTVKKL